MVKLTPLMRVILTALAAGIAAVGAQADSIPQWMQIVVVVCSTILAAVGIVPPQVPTVTTVVAREAVREPQPPLHTGKIHGGDV